MKENIGKFTTPSGEGASIELKDNIINLDGKLTGSGVSLSDITNIDLNTVISTGSYISHKYSKDLHYPYIFDDVIEKDCILNVITDVDNETILQILSIDNRSEFKRYYKNDIWEGWIQTNGIVLNEFNPDHDTFIYVSKNGNDNNSGLFDTEPLATIEEAIRRIRTSQAFSSDGSSVIYLGSGDWGSFILDSYSQCVVFRGYDFNSKTVFSNLNDDLPYFTSFAPRDNAFVILDYLHFDLLNAGFHSKVRMTNCKFNSCRSRYGAKIFIESSTTIGIVNSRSSSHTYLFDAYNDARISIGTNITFDILEDVSYSYFSYIRGYSVLDIYQYSTIFYLNPDKLTVSYVYRITNSGELNSDIGLNSEVWSIPFTYTHKLYLDATSKLPGVIRQFELPITETQNQRPICTYSNVDPETGIPSTNNYSGWNIYPNIPGCKGNVTEYRLGVAEFCNYIDGTRSWHFDVSKTLGTNSGVARLSVGFGDKDQYSWLKVGELKAFANCPSYKTGTQSHILTIADAPVYITEMGGDSNAWYKKYSNGFIEQGGYAKSTLSSTNVVVTFPIAFTSTKYFIKKNRAVESTSNMTYKGENFYNLTNTSATTWIGTEILEFTWYACGY